MTPFTSKGTLQTLPKKIESIQREHDKVETAKAGDNIGIKVTEHAREHDEVFKVTEE